MEILRQLGELFLRSVPTVILVFLFYLFLRYAFFQPIDRTLAERTERIETARAEAVAMRLRAQEKLNEYSEALKKARGALFAEQEAARQVVLEERGRLLRDARANSQEVIRQAKAVIRREFEAAHEELERQTAGLAKEIVQVVLERRGTASRDELQ